MLVHCERIAGFADRAVTNETVRPSKAKTKSFRIINSVLRNCFLLSGQFAQQDCQLTPRQQSDKQTGCAHRHYTHLNEAKQYRNENKERFRSLNKSPKCVTNVGYGSG